MCNLQAKTRCGEEMLKVQQVVGKESLAEGWQGKSIKDVGSCKNSVVGWSNMFVVFVKNLILKSKD